MTVRALPFSFWNTSAQGVPSDQQVAGTVDEFLALLDRVAPTVEPHPSLLPDTRPVGDPTAAVLVPCDRCDGMHHPDRECRA